MKILTILLISTILSFPCYSQSLENIQSPEQLIEWLSDNFKEHTTIPDKIRNLEDIIETKEGDCDDFAQVSSTMLNNLGMENKIIIIKFEGLKILHAVCVYKDIKNEYNIISRRKLLYTTENTIEGAIKKHYPDTEKITIWEDYLKKNYYKTRR